MRLARCETACWPTTKAAASITRFPTACTPHDNVILGNGFAEYPGAWAHPAPSRYRVRRTASSSATCWWATKEGFNFREQDRTTPRIHDPTPQWIWNHDQTIRNNVLAYNRDAQTWGWFNISDDRHWPAAMQAKRPEAGQAQDDLARDYVAKSKKGAPVGLSLEKLKFTFENNLYVATAGRVLFNWGTDWQRNRQYVSLDTVRKELVLENGSRQQAEICFSNLPARDFRVLGGSLILTMGCYPQGTVPGVRLGVTTGKP